MTTTALAKLGKNEHVRTETLTKICEALDCSLDDIAEITHKADKGVKA